MVIHRFLIYHIRSYFIAIVNTLTGVITTRSMDTIVVIISLVERTCCNQLMLPDSRPMLRAFNVLITSAEHRRPVVFYERLQAQA